MKLLIPPEIKEHIERKCQSPRHREKFAPLDVLAPLKEFIDKKLQLLDSRLFQIYKSHARLSPRTLSHAWNEDGNPNDGAEENLRELLCYFGFNKNWSNTLSSLGKTEEEIITWTGKQKSKTLDISAFSKIHVSPFSQPIQSLSIQKVYIELLTRKAVIPFDENNDVIAEVYDSWYKLFCMIREELKVIPSNRKIEIEILIHILNNVLRPHLTTHQAIFRAWFASAMLQNSDNLAPQRLQRNYPNYFVLISSLRKVNNELKDSAEQLSKLISDSTR